jgi:hypothetical protein
LKVDAPIPFVAEVLGNQIRFFVDGRMLEGAEEERVLDLLGVRPDAQRKHSFGWMDHPAAQMMLTLTEGPARLQDPLFMLRLGETVMKDTDIYNTPVKKVIVNELVRRGMAEKFESGPDADQEDRVSAISLRLTEEVNRLEVLLECLRRNLPVAEKAFAEIERRAFQAANEAKAS